MNELSLYMLLSSLNQTLAGIRCTCMVDIPNVKMGYLPVVVFFKRVSFSSGVLEQLYLKFTPLLAPFWLKGILTDAE